MEPAGSLLISKPSPLRISEKVLGDIGLLSHQEPIPLYQFQTIPMLFVQQALRYRHRQHLAFTAPLIDPLEQFVGRGQYRSPSIPY
jgi:hypothetical protein